jgi:hypothetical protein
VVIGEKMSETSVKYRPEDYDSKGDPDWIHPRDRAIAHICTGMFREPNKETRKTVRPYPSVFCSSCGTNGNVVDLSLNDLVRMLNGQMGESNENLLR